MSFSDPIADLLTRIRNALHAKHRYVDMDWSKMQIALLGILKEQGFIENFAIRKESQQRGTIRVFLKYAEECTPVIQMLKRCSKPGLRKYWGVNEIQRVRGGLGIAIMSTSQGVMTGQEARKRKVGGELLCQVW